MPTSSNSSILLEPKLSARPNRKDDPLEVSVHTLPKPLLREFRHVFSENYLENFPTKPSSSSSQQQQQQQGDSTMMMETEENNNNTNTHLLMSMELLALPTNQQARQDLVAVGDEIEKEKDRLLNVFLEFGDEICNRIRSLGYWADYIDPCSGLPMLTRNCNKVYSEVDGMECLLNYKSYNAGFCKILTHPKWGSSVYPATIFVHAPKEPIINLLQEYYI